MLDNGTLTIAPVNIWLVFGSMSPSVSMAPAQQVSYFQANRHRLNLATDPTWYQCEEEMENTTHCLTRCGRWNHCRWLLQSWTKTHLS